MENKYEKGSVADKIAGALYGMAIGDAFGMPGELWPKAKIVEFFDGWIGEFLDGPASNDVACNYKAGQFTDDTGQGLVILDAIIANDFKVNPADIARRLSIWADENDAYENNILGPTSKVAIKMISEGKDPAEFTDQALSNGSAMRIPAVGCLFKPADSHKLVNYVAEITRVTHSSDVTITGAAMIAQAVASAVGGRDFDQLIVDVLSLEELALTKGAPTISPLLSERINLAISISKDFSSDDRGFIDKLYKLVGAGVPIIESVPAALGLAYHFRDPNKVAEFTANIGGDTDTIGAMATAICGAYTGFSAINPAYIAKINEANGTDFDFYINELIRGRNLV